MKKITMLFSILAFSLVALIAYAQDKVVVIPLNSSTGGPGDWKTVSVSSLGGIPRDSVNRTGVINTPCGDWGRYANDSYGVEALTVPIQLPDRATVVSFTGLFCDSTASYMAEMVFYRSDNIAIAQVMTGVGEASTTTLTKTDTTITAGAEVVDNSKYTYHILMYINGSAGSALYPVSGIVTLQ